jgi:hypothetical protein
MLLAERLADHRHRRRLWSMIVIREEPALDSARAKQIEVRTIHDLGCDLHGLACP